MYITNQLQKLKPCMYISIGTNQLTLMYEIY